MGTKMSCGKGSGDQNTDSDLTPASPPCSFVHKPSYSQQMPENERSSEDMRTADLCQSALTASGHAESHVNMSAHISCQPTGNAVSQVEMDTGLQVTSMRSPMVIEKVKRKRGRPAKIKRPSSVEKRDSEFAETDANQHKAVSTTIALPTASVDHSTDDSDPHLISGSSQDERPGTDAVLTDRVDGDGGFKVKRRRGRPKKSESTPLQHTVSKTPSNPLPHPNNLGWTLRSRGEHLSPQNGNSDSNYDTNQTEGTSAEMVHSHGVRRRRRRTKPFIGEQVPAKVAKLDDFTEASPVFNYETECAGKTETDERVELSNNERLKRGAYELVELANDEQVEHGADARVEQPAEEPVEHGADEQGEHGTDEQVKHGANEWVEQPAKEPVEHGADEQVEHGTDEQVEHGTDEQVEHGTDAWVEQPAEEPEEHGADEWVEQPAKEPEKHGADEQVEHGADAWVEPPAKEPEKHGADEQVEHGADAWVEQPAKEPEKNGADGRMEQPAKEPEKHGADQQVEHGADAWVEQPAKEPEKHGADGWMEQPAKEPEKHGANEWVEQPAEEPEKHGADEQVEHGADAWMEQPAKEPEKHGADEQVEHGADAWVEQPAKEPEKHGADEQVEHGADAWVEQPAKEPEKHGADAWVEQPAKEPEKHGADEQVEHGPDAWVDQPAKEPEKHCAGGRMEQVTDEKLKRGVDEWMEPAAYEPVKRANNEQVELRADELEKVTDELIKHSTDVAVEQAERVEHCADERVEPCTEEKEINTNSNAAESSVQQERMQLTEEVKFPPEPEKSSAEDLDKPYLVNPPETKTSDITKSLLMNDREEPQLETPKSCGQPNNADVPQAESDSIHSGSSHEKTGSISVKSENIETELNALATVSDTCASQNSTETSVKLPNREYVVYRCKKGGKRKRRIIKVLQPSNNYVEKAEPTPEVEQNPDCGKVKTEAGLDGNDIIYVRKGGKNLLKCNYCGRLFKFLSQLVVHQRIHTGERPFKCTECGKGFTKNSNLNLHLKMHLKNNMYQKCQLCKSRVSISQYASHMEMHTGGVEDHAPIFSYRETETPSLERSSSSQEIQKESPPEKKGTKTCQYCGKTFPFQSALKRHIRIHTGEKPYKCDICGKAFGQSYFLRVHELTHWTVKRYNCTRCEKSFSHYSNAKNHTCRPIRGSCDSQAKRRIKPSLTYTCHICKNVFEHLQNFNSHMKEHTGTKLFRCLYCDKLFSVISDFEAHRIRCATERKVSGTIKEEEMMTMIHYRMPNRSFPKINDPPPDAALALKPQQRKRILLRRKRSSDLKKPIRTQASPPPPASYIISKLNQLDTRSDPRKYLCPSCGRQFRHMGRLRAHMLTHSTKQTFPCTHCGKTLGSWKKLWQHQRVHRQPAGRFTCPRCGRGFRYVSSYRKHMNEHPEFRWVQQRPKKVFLPYQCEQCTSTFRTLDLLFTHQLCHSSVLDLRKETDLVFLTDSHSSQSMAKVSPSPTKLILGASHPSDVLNHSQKHPHLTPQTSPTDKGFTTCPNRTHSVEECDDVMDNGPRKPTALLKHVKSPRTQNTNRLKNGLSDSLECAVCGGAFPAVSDLFHHYVDHARGHV